MKFIRQRCESDCFPTCIAMIANISHREAVELVHPLHYKGTGYSTYDERGVRVLRDLGFKVRKRYITSFNKLKQVAIISIQFAGESGGHVAIWDPERKKVLEPYRNYQKLTIADYKKNLRFVYLISR